MKKIIKLLIAVIVLTTTTQSFAQSRSEDPIPLIDVVVEKTPPGHNGIAAQTDPNGYIIYRSLAAGNYIISDRHGNKAMVKHSGGPAKWRLVVGIKNGRPIWTLVDESTPL